jgi:hypothetical protein
MPREKLGLLQLGWRASDEYYDGGQPAVGTTQPWQVYAWTTVRYGTLYISVISVNLTREGVSVQIYVKSKGWRQKWNKDEAIRSGFQT